MNLTQYNAMLEGDTKLAVRLAVTMGWIASLIYIIEQNGLRVFVEDPAESGWRCVRFDPFTDTSIPYGLIGRGVHIVAQAKNSKPMASAGFNQPWVHAESKTHAIINAYCAADPLGHWAKFLSTKE